MKHVDYTPLEQEKDGFFAVAKSGLTSCKTCGAVKPRVGWRTECKGNVRVELRAATTKGGRA